MGTFEAEGLRRTWVACLRKETWEAEVEGKSLQIRRTYGQRDNRIIMECSLCRVLLHYFEPHENPTFQLRKVMHGEAEVSRNHTTSTRMSWSQDWIPEPSDSNACVLSPCAVSPLLCTQISPKLCLLVYSGGLFFSLAS